jgi:CubicO group peptidase (beta-lactamase class C family)
MRWLLTGAAVASSLLSLVGPPAHAELLPERVAKAAQERIATDTVQTLVFGVVDGDKSEVIAFGKLDDGKSPDGDTVYEIGSITRPLRQRCSPARCWLGA